MFSKPLRNVNKWILNCLPMSTPANMAGVPLEWGWATPITARGYQVTACRGQWLQPSSTLVIQKWFSLNLSNWAKKRCERHQEGLGRNTGQGEASFVSWSLDMQHRSFLLVNIKHHQICAQNSLSGREANFRERDSLKNTKDSQGKATKEEEQREFRVSETPPSLPLLLFLRAASRGPQAHLSGSEEGRLTLNNRETRAHRIISETCVEMWGPAGSACRIRDDFIKVRTQTWFR